MTAFDVLLEVQAHDTRLDQLQHQLDALPARAERDAAREALAAAEDHVVAETEVHDDLGRRQQRLDDEIETVKAKRAGVEARLYGTGNASARELQDLQDDSESLARRIRQLEDQEIEIMEALEPVDANLAELTATRNARRTVLEDAERALTAAEAELAVALDAERAEREATAAGVDAALLAEYDALRRGRGGIAVSRLVGSQCGACHLTLSAVEVARIRKHPDEVTHCEECGRLLVP